MNSAPVASLHTRRTRLILPVVVTVLSATAWACAPALQEPSSLKVATPRIDERLNYVPSYIDCLSAPERRPQRISLNCARTDSYLRDITWDEWLSDSAHGTATRVTSRSERTERTRRSSRSGRPADSNASGTVSVTLSEPVHTAFGLVFTELRVNDSLVTP